MIKKFYFFVAIVFFSSCSKNTREIIAFNSDWEFSLDPQSTGDTTWRKLNLPHDWSIEGSFEEKNPAGTGGGALPGGIGWYRKTFFIDDDQQDRLTFITFDGVYRNSEVWVNGHYLGKRPNGYISFQYVVTPYLHYGKTKNTIVVKVDNSQQPNSRWYSGSGIYRHVNLVSTNKIFVDQWGTQITTPKVSAQSATVTIKTTIRNALKEDRSVTLTTILVNAERKEVGKMISKCQVLKDSVQEVEQQITIIQPSRWSVDKPILYKAISSVAVDEEIMDTYETNFGIRDFEFNSEKGFFLNGAPLKIKGVCLHHDLGCLGTAVNKRAIERQLQIMKGMGVNGIRTSHNPPAPELLDLCDQMGFIVMDEAFDMWKKEKTKFDYHLDWDQWHKRDLEDQIRRDRNHPSVFIWSIGNEVIEQYDRTDSAGAIIARELAGIVKSNDPTRPVTAACNDVRVDNPLYHSGALDLIGFNYHHESFENFLKDYPGKKFIATETTSALETRGYYDMPSDSVRIWPIAWDKPFVEGNPDNSVSAYDNVRTPWGSTHEDTWKIMKRHKFLSGMFVWTGFDYIGEPTPYGWPSRSSYFGVVDLAGFPKDVYYLYKSEWTNDPILHIFPHWNWPDGKIVDVVAYTNAEEVELFVNDKSLGVKRKQNDELHMMWRTTFVPGTLRAVARSHGKAILTKEVKTAGKPAKIILEADRSTLHPNCDDLAFVTVKVVDENGIVVPDAANLVQFSTKGNGFLTAVDNGDPVSHESFKDNKRKAFHGLCLAVVQATGIGIIELTASSSGLKDEIVSIEVK